MPATRSLLAVLVAAIRTGRSMIGAGIDARGGGGWAALLILEVTCSLAASGVALS